MHGLTIKIYKLYKLIFLILFKRCCKFLSNQPCWWRRQVRLKRRVFIYQTKHYYILEGCNLSYVVTTARKPISMKRCFYLPQDLYWCTVFILMSSFFFWLTSNVNSWAVSCQTVLPFVGERSLGLACIGPIYMAMLYVTSCFNCCGHDKGRISSFLLLSHRPKQVLWRLLHAFVTVEEY